MTDYFLFGWRVRSAVPIPEAMTWDAMTWEAMTWEAMTWAGDARVGDDRPVDVSIRLGAAPLLVDPLRHGRGPIQVGRDGTCHLSIDGVGNFLVSGGREVIVEPAGDVTGAEFQGWLLGAVVGMLCHQRRQFPLHAACVGIGGGAAALSGRPGAGKSTLAAALVRRGHALITDDVCVIDSTTADGIAALPGFPRLRLWEDSLRALAISADERVRSGSGKRKFHFYEAGAFAPQPVRLEAVYFLKRPNPGEQDDIRSQAGADAAAILSSEIYRRRIGFRLGHKVALLTEAMRIAAAVPIFRLPIRPDLAELDRTAARLEAHFASLDRDHK